MVRTEFSALPIKRASISLLTISCSLTFSAGYEPYGEEYETSGSTLMTYAGAVYDPVTGLYLMGARYYSPVLQRFVQQDSYSGTVDAPLSLNRYAYVGDSPVTYTDPSGHSWWSEFTKAISSAVNTVLEMQAGEVDAAVNAAKAVYAIDGAEVNLAVHIANTLTAMQGEEVNLAVSVFYKTFVTGFDPNLNPNGPLGAILFLIGGVMTSTALIMTPGPGQLWGFVDAYGTAGTLYYMESDPSDATLSGAERAYGQGVPQLCGDYPEICDPLV